ncbi:hypothetical protein [Amycolatopsis anabasis]|uniref:hypothetical protein n=1 Tax=Amycolatopsis anabasis TaxID=1840409 RepID=UPI00131E998F|nr:hypothetical protein [Amycolatopsis anabasis]
MNPDGTVDSVDIHDALFDDSGLYQGLLVEPLIVVDPHDQPGVHSLTPVSHSPSRV